MSSATFIEDDFRAQAAQDNITHISTGVAVVRNGKVLVARRTAADFLGGNYELPGGGVDDGETIIESAIREVAEETGLIVTKIITPFAGFDYSTDRKPRARQINFVVEVKPGNVRLDPAEHDTYLWVDLASLAELPMSDSMRQCVVSALEIIKKVN